MSDETEDWHPLAWEIARLATPFPHGSWSPTDPPKLVRVHHRTFDGGEHVGLGATTTAAAQDLALKLTEWGKR